MKLFKYLAANYFTIIGGIFLGLSLPISSHGIIIRDNLMMDFVIFAPIGILLMGISYYYRFINK